MVGPQTLRRVASAWSPMIAITSDYLVTDNVQADTLGLVFSSVRDVLFSQRAPQTKLQVPLQSVSLEGRTVAEIDDDIETTNASRVEPFDPSFTRRVIAAAGPNANPRVRKVMASLVLHLHDFCRENEITADEYLRGVELINAAGKMSDDNRDETKLLLAILGTESLVNAITHKATPSSVAEKERAPTALAMSNHSWRLDAPLRQMGELIFSGFENNDDKALIHGRILDAVTDEPIPSAELYVCQTAPNGAYERQDSMQPNMNLSGRFVTGDDGRYSFHCLRPTDYPVPDDGPTGRVLKLLDRCPWLPAHVHFSITAKGHRKLVTQIFDRRSEHVGGDAAFAVEEGLVVDFVQTVEGTSGQVIWVLEYDFRL